ncbi:MAG: hypothetical protein LBE18_02145, partial [Planctomycetaceae bacterium]|nr:hypothetical protein [Planctomycetaceae bacterium]
EKSEKSDFVILDFVILDFKFKLITKKYFSWERRRPACIFLVQKTPKDAVETTAFQATINYITRNVMIRI